MNEDGKPDCICGNDPSWWRHSTECPLRYWHETAEIEARCIRYEEALRAIVKYKPGTLWTLADEIAIYEAAHKALFKRHDTGTNEK